MGEFSFDTYCIVLLLEWFGLADTQKYTVPTNCKKNTAVHLKTELLCPSRELKLDGISAQEVKKQALLFMLCIFHKKLGQKHNVVFQIPSRTLALLT